MICENVTEQLGLYVDGELSPAALGDVEAHLATCSSCQTELKELRDMAAGFAGPADVPVPEALWASIEERLDAELHDPPAVSALHQKTPTARPMWYRRGPVALAAVLALAIGLGMYGLVWTQPSAAAAHVDYSVLLDALPLDAQKAFRKFLEFYDAREGSPAEARRYAPDLDFAVPETLPGGFHLESVYLLRFGDLPGVAAGYERDGEFLGAVFHRPIHKENFGPHKNYPCMVGRHEGHKVSVGEWKLVHLMDPTTCHCVLSRLDEEKELPAVMAAVAPNFPDSGAAPPQGD